MTPGRRMAGEKQHAPCPTVDANLERWALLVFYVMLVVTMAVEVLRREVFSYSSIWGEEIVRYSFIYLAWIGAAAAVRERGAHPHRRDLGIPRRSRVKALLYIFGDLVMAAVAIFALLLVFETLLIGRSSAPSATGCGCRWCGSWPPCRSASG